jgi:hypothetical protein
LAIAAALGVSDGLRWIKAREPHLPKPFRARPLQVALGVLLAVVGAASLYYNRVTELHAAEQAVWYGALFDELQARGHSSDVIILDGGFGGGTNYNPVLKFYAGIARMNGLRVKLPALDTAPSWWEGGFEGARNYNPYADIAGGVRVEIPTLLPMGELVATCDPKLVPWLKHQDGFSLGGEVHSCIFGVAHF